MLAGDPQESQCWMCLTTLWEYVRSVSIALSAGGAYTMHSCTWGMGGHTG